MASLGYDSRGTSRTLFFNSGSFPYPRDCLSARVVPYLSGRMHQHTERGTAAPLFCYMISCYYMLEGINPARTVVFTGHRSLTGECKHVSVRAIEPVLIKCLDLLMDCLYTEGYDTYITGMAEGFDLLAAQAVLDKKRNLKNLRLIGFDPYPGFRKSLPLHRLIENNADIMYTVSKSYFRGCYQVRNVAMLDHCSTVIGYFNGQPGGTANTIRVARNRGLRIFNLCSNPEAVKFNHKADSRIIDELMKISLGEDSLR